MSRVDLALVERGLALSRNRAQELVLSGRVFVGAGDSRRVVSKVSARVKEEDVLEVVPAGKGEEFVSRGGLKMRGALDQLKLSVQGFRILDVGISTGGFTDCLLRAGASRVVGVDVGHGQLALPLRGDGRICLVEGVNARDLSKQHHLTQIFELNEGHKFDLIVIDVSFISLTLVLPELIQYLRGSPESRPEPQAKVLALVKPQYEVGRTGLGKNGIVKDSSLFVNVEEKIRLCCVSNHLVVEEYFASSIEGTDGNREFFVYAKPVKT
jgi:23S rRNA (cytidine1920-2'-O)/16S rRNA (cytidine1409-2'-O)-methyltransferase